MKLKKFIRRKYYQLKYRENIDWYEENYASQKELKKRYYSVQSPRCLNEEKTVICMFDGRYQHGGLSDRLKGITGIYQICKALGIQFKIHFNSPFDLTKVFLPNDVDWTIKESELCYNSKDVIAFNFIDRTYQYPVETQKELITQLIERPFKQIHLYTNVSFTYGDGTFPALFNELFILNDKIREDLKPHIDQLGEDYICVSSRFCSLLGDLEDMHIQELTEQERDLLVARCVDQLEKIHQQYPTQKMLVTSDSVRFTQSLTHLPYVYTLDSKVKVNIDRTDIRDFEILKDSILDYFLIAHASKIIQIKSDLMYNGYFSQSASFLYNKPYELFEF